MDVTATTSFLCQGCGRRFLADQLYLAPSTRALLDAGEPAEQRWVHGRRCWCLIPLVCSPECATQAPVRLLTHLQVWLGIKRDYRSYNAQRQARAAHEETVACTRISGP